MNTTSSPQAIKVLLIDDSESDYLLTSRLLKKSGSQHFLIEWVSDYQTGLQLIGQEAHDVYLIDYNLKPGDGVALVENARQQGCQKCGEAFHGMNGRIGTWWRNVEPDAQCAEFSRL